MVRVLKPFSVIIATALSLGLSTAGYSASGTPVSVLGDATYTIDGPICSGAGKAPAGTRCPLKGDTTCIDCHEGIPSYNGGKCVAPEDAHCVIVSGDTWGCAYPDHIYHSGHDYHKDDYHKDDYHKDDYHKDDYKKDDYHKDGDKYPSGGDYKKNDYKKDDSKKDDYHKDGNKYPSGDDYKKDDYKNDDYHKDGDKYPSGGDYKKDDNKKDDYHKDGDKYPSGDDYKKDDHKKDEY
ncbi:Hypothetical protein PHPALM_11390, partial [Phytophthora palmivora]